MPQLKEAGVAALRRGDPSLALRYLSAAYREDPQDAELLNYLGVTCGRLNLLDRAVGTLREGVRLAPHSPELQYNLGLALYESDQWEPAAECFERTLELDPFHERARRALGRLARDGAKTRTYLKNRLLASGYELPMDGPVQHLLPLLAAQTPEPRSPSALARWEGQEHPGAVHYRRFQLGAAGVTLFLLGALVGPQLFSIFAPAATDAAPTYTVPRASARSRQAEQQEIARRLVQTVRQMDRPYRKAKRAVDRLAKRTGTRRQAAVLVSAYLAAVDSQKTGLQAVLNEARTPLPSGVRDRVLRAVDSYREAGKSWESFLDHGDAFWRREAVIAHAAAQRELEAAMIALGWQLDGDRVLSSAR